jgi:hypothetical protein
VDTEAIRTDKQDGHEHNEKGDPGRDCSRPFEQGPNGFREWKGAGRRWGSIG